MASPSLEAALRASASLPRGGHVGVAKGIYTGGERALPGTAHLADQLSGQLHLEFEASPSFLLAINGELLVCW